MTNTKPNKINRAAALVEINGEVMLLKLSTHAWQEILDIAARDAGGELVVSKVPNQNVLNDISTLSV
ncbi:hypothetical protein PY793_09465 [Acetobacter fabarum]|uniref:hypothetical protein n=1 Tax=Acetobacter TaxID=434 RepID=UPI001BAB1A0A|nr:hypothetical protein [Acetobacter okinawensis]MBS0987825.1 hypothetical protein [Acetobacter okinawensis]